MPQHKHLCCFSLKASLQAFTWWDVPWKGGCIREGSNCRTNLNLPLAHCPAYMHFAFCTLPSLCAFCTKEYAACTLPSLYAFCTPCTFYTLPSLCNAFCTTEYAAHTLPYLAIHFAHCPPYAMNSALQNMLLLRILPTWMFKALQ